MALIFTIVLAWLSRGHWAIVVFGITMITCYVASTLHHGVRGSALLEEGLRRFDHSAIYLLIAGTYTPILWVVLEGQMRFYWLVGIWLVAAFGIVLKSVSKPPEWFSLLIYVGMGWVAVLLFPKFMVGLPFPSLLALVIGGLFYTFGVPFYALGQRPWKRGWWTPHEIWHLFVLSGSVAHFVMAVNLVQQS